MVRATSFVSLASSSHCTETTRHHENTVRGKRERPFPRRDRLTAAQGSSDDRRIDIRATRLCSIESLWSAKEKLERVIPEERVPALFLYAVRDRR